MRNPPQAPDGRRLLLLGLGGCWLGGWLMLVAGCNQSAEAPANEEDETRLVRVAVAAPRPLERMLTVLGALEPYQETTLSAKVDGRLESIDVDIGSAVKAGKVLAKIETRDYELKLRQAEAALAQARARLGLDPAGTDDAVDIERSTLVKEAEAVFEEAKLSRERLQQLTEARVIASSELDVAEATYQVALNRFEAAREQVRERLATMQQRRAELEIARQQEIDTRLTAPFAGVVQMRRASPGQFLRPGDPVLVLVQVDPLRLRLEIPEAQAGRIAVGQEVRFTVTGFLQTNSVRVTRISPALQRGNRMLVVEADVPNDGTLHPGAFADSRVVVERGVPALAVPAEALRVFAGLEKVLVEKDGVVEERDVITGDHAGPWVEITKGLKPGERVILEPGGLRTGERVRVQISS